MKKKYQSLTYEQKARGVIFSSQLMPGGTSHEVTTEDWKEDQAKAEKTIENLKDDKFFNKSSYKYNEIRR